MKNFKCIWTMILMSLLVLSACGGSSTPTAPTASAPAPTTPAPTTPAPGNVNLTVSGKSLDFTWTLGSSVDHYRISVNYDGASGFLVDPAASNIANTATSHSIEIPVHKTDWLAAQYIVEGCNATETSCVASPNQTLTLIDSVAATIYVKASNTNAGDYFGYSVSLSGDGNTLAVGAYWEDSVATGIGGDQADNAALNAGAVYVFSRTGTAWTQQAYVKASNAAANDQFGRSVSLNSDGNTMAVGAYLEDSIATGIDGNQADNAAVDSGAVYVFSRTGTVWTQQAYVKASNTNAWDQFGSSVSLSGDGNTLAVGAPPEDSAAVGIDGIEGINTAVNAGAVYVFSRTGAVWTQQAYVKASNTDPGDLFGWTVSLNSDGNTLAVGAYNESSVATGVGGNETSNAALSSGAVYVFSRTPATQFLPAFWGQQAYIKASNTEADDWFGSFLSLSGDGSTLAVGAPGEDSAATGIGGDQADNTAAVSGAVYVFSRTAAIWTQQIYVKASNTDPGDLFGSSISLNSDGNTLAVGAASEANMATGVGGNQTDNTASDSGSVYVFQRINVGFITLWLQQSYVKAPNTDLADSFASSVSLSSDGNTLAVGAASEDSAAVGIGGDQADNTIGAAGAVYLY